MTVAAKYILLALLAAGALAFLAAGARAAAANFHRLRTWKRYPATVRVANAPEVVEVQVGDDSGQPTLKIPRTHDAGYGIWSQVTVIENPANPEERRLTGFFDLWNPVLVAAVFCLGFLIATWLVGTTTWGVDAVWTGGAWQAAPAVAVETAPDLEVHEPRESWKANLFYGCILGLLMGVPAFFVRGGWRPWPAIVAVVGLGFFLWMVQSAVSNYTRTVRLSPAGLEERTFFGSRRIGWDDLGGLEFQDVRKQLEAFNRPEPGQSRKFSTIPRIDIWMVKDRQGRDVFSLPAEMTPPATFRALRERIGRRPQS